MKDPNHPAWPIIRMGIILVALILILWLNAEHFDVTEIRTIISMFLALLGAEGVSKIFQKKED